MPIQFECSHCQRQLRTPDDTAGKKCRCPGCGQVMPIPGLGQPSAQSTAGESDWDDAGDESWSDSQSTEPTSYHPEASQPFPNPPSSSPNPYASPEHVIPSVPIHSGLPPHRGGMILGFGIASILTSIISCGCCVFFFPVSLGFAIPALTMANHDLGRMKSRQIDPSGMGMTQAGKICAIIGLVFCGLAVVFFFFSLILNVGFFDVDMFD